MKIKTVVFLLVVSLFLLNGCATVGRERNLELQRLRNQVTVLESQLQSKDDEILSLKECLARQAQEKEVPIIKETGKKKVLCEAKSRPNAKQIQTALKNAGFYVGSIDGKIGRKTIDAIRAFQKANNLSADGKVGKATWELLREYLEKKIK